MVSHCFSLDRPTIAHGAYDQEPHEVPNTPQPCLLDGEAAEVIPFLLVYGETDRCSSDAVVPVNDHA